ncbi:MAG: metal ABC transporter permease [Xanthobacteraceae bacterium]
MSDVIALLLPPFLVALCLIGIHTYFGLQVLARNVIFVDLALAQIAALGATLAFMLGHPTQGVATYVYSLAFTLIAAFLLAFTRSWSQRIPQEALIGVIYVVAAAAAILMIDRAPQGAEHLKQILTGNILTTGTSDLFAIAPLYLAIGLVHWALWRWLKPIEGAAWLWEFMFYASFGVVVTSSVAVAGVLLVFSFLIMPAAVGVLFAETLPRQLAIGWTAGTIASAAGLAASYLGDLPTGAAMVCAFGVMLALAGLIFALRLEHAGQIARRLVIAGRWCAALIMAASAVLLMAAPRADQPLFDVAEYLVPSVRGLYLTRSEVDIYQDAAIYAERYRRQADELNELETRSRAAGEALDDLAVRRISSFIKSYSEMRRGEEFVKREVRARARERIRWVVGGTVLLATLAIAPGVLSRVVALGRRGRRAGVPREGRDP